MDVYVIYAICDTRIYAIFSDKKQAELFAKKIAEREGYIYETDILVIKTPLDTEINLDS